MGTPTTDHGVFDYIANNPNMVDYEYEKVVDYDEKKARWSAGDYYMRTKGRSVEVKTHRFFTWEGVYETRTWTTDTATTVTTVGTSYTLGVADETGVRVDMPINYARDADEPILFMVTAVATGVITVRLIANGAGAAVSVPTSTTLHSVAGNFTEENDNGTPTPAFVHPTRNENSVGIIRRTSELTKIEMATDLRTAMDSIEEKKSQGNYEFEKDLSTFMWTSTITQDTTNRLFTSKGILTQITSATDSTKIAAGGALTFVDVANMIEGLEEFATTTEFMGFCGTIAKQNIADLGEQGGIGNVSTSESEYGYAGQAFRSGEFKLDLVTEPVFKRLGDPYNKYIAVISPKDIQLAHMKGQKFQFEGPFQENPGSERLLLQWRAVVGVKMHHAKRHGLISGLALAT